MRFLVFAISVHLAMTGPEARDSHGLNQYVLRYETLDYDRGSVAAQRSRSSASGVHLSFQSHGKLFKLKLDRDTSVLNADAEFVSEDDARLEVDTSHLYAGYLEDDPHSRAYGSISDGVFDGKIYSSDGIFYVERASKYQLTNTSTGVHSIIYRDDDVLDPYGQHVDGSVRNPKENLKSHLQNEIYGRIKRRAAESNELGTCSVSVTIDPYMWKYFSKLNHGNAELTKRDINSLIAQHFAAVSSIYRSTVFEGKYLHRIASFQVIHVKYHDLSECAPDYRGTENRYCRQLDAANLLELHSEANHEAVCLSYVFTCRDFENGVLGLAWLARPTVNVAGVCARRSKPFYAKPDTVASLNTGIVSFINYGHRIPSKVTELTLAHEIGHSLGSPHDSPSHCKSNRTDGNNYIMFETANPGTKQRNHLLSACSRANISHVLDDIREGRRFNCFKKESNDSCGNQIVEYGEECDCGFDDEDCTDTCCYPANITPYVMINPDAKPCTLKPGSECSPSAGPCCDQNCNLIGQRSRKLCRDSSECAEKSFCNGRSVSCPKPEAKPDGISCNRDTQLCINGKCAGSICLRVDMNECFLTPDRFKDIRKQCEVACQVGNDSSTCKGTSQLSAQFQTAVTLGPGAPCNYYKGFCDSFSRCRPIIANGPLVRILNSLLTRQNWRNVHEWLTEFWWAVVLMCLFFFVFIAAIIKCCAMHIPSSNPNKRPALSISHTLRHPRRALKGQQPLSHSVE